MNRQKITDFIFNDGEYFVANLDGGGVRIGLKDFCSTDFPCGHDQYDHVVGLGRSGFRDSIEEFSDSIYAKHFN